MGRSLAFVALLALVFALAGPHRVRALCVSTEGSYALLNEEIGPRGTLVFGSVLRRRGPGLPSLEGLELAVLTLPVRFRRIEIAPGLHGVVPSEALGLGGGELRAGTARASFRVVDVPRPHLARPVVRALVRSEETSLRTSVTTLRARFASPPPEDAVAVVVRSLSGPIAWAQLYDDEVDVVVASVGSRCFRTIEGYEVPPLGSRVRLSWLDADGQLSPASRPVAVTP